MQQRIDKSEIRHEKIRSMLIANDLVTVNEFCKILNCSEATVRNDLRYLEEMRLIKRTHGGAVATGSTALNSNMSMRSAAFKHEKDIIANYVINHILFPGQTIILDSGTTNTEIAQKIVESSLELTVLTNSFTAASILSRTDRVKLYIAGGCCDHMTSSFYDETAKNLFNTMRADIFFLSVNGISHEVGFTISGHEEASVKQAMIKCSQKCIVTADHSKLGKIGLKVVCGFGDVDTLITDGNANMERVKKLKNTGLNVITISNKTVWTNNKNRGA